MITLFGRCATSVQYACSFQDPGFSAELDGVPIQVTVNGSVNTSSPLGTIHSLTYTAVTFPQQEAETKTRSVTTLDLNNPVLTLLGNNPLSLLVNDTYGDAGFQVLDDHDGDVSNLVSVSGWDESTAAADQFSKNYSIQDSIGNSASIVRTISVADLLPKPDHYIAGPIGSPTTFSTMPPHFPAIYKR